MFKILAFQILIAVAVQWFFVDSVWAGRLDFKIFDIKKNLPLNDEEPVRYDYYTSIGRDQGVEKGAVLTVYRRVPVMDIYKNQSHDDMLIPVAKIQIIYSERTMSVGRVVKTADPEKIPVLEYSKIMAGDRVEIAGLNSSIDSIAFGEKAEVNQGSAPDTTERKIASGPTTPSTEPKVEVKAKP